MPPAPKGKDSKKNEKSSPEKKKGEKSNEDNKKERKADMKRIAELAVPIIRKSKCCNDKYWKVKRTALRYRASWRIKDLAYPRFIVTKVSNRRKRKSKLISGVSPWALKYIATDRIIDLSLPKGCKFS